MTKIRRFPRLLKDYPDAHLTKSMKVSMKLAENRIPRGYDKLTRRQKKLAKKIINGMTVKDACKTMGMDKNTFYRYMHFHPKFKAYYLAYAQKASTEMDGRLDAKLGRAIQIVENALDSPDDYFAHESAVKFLTGRGFYTKSVKADKNITKNVNIHGEIKHTHKPMDKDFMMAFVQAFSNMTGSGKEIEPKVVKGKTVSKVINALPEPAPSADINTQIQKIDQAKIA